ncbi:MAG: TIGR00282 family metallophosphoesterase [Candidatus Buchananbacteria bacterium]
MLKILFIGDIVGKMGRLAVTKLLPKLKTDNHLDLVIANAENLAHGTGLTASTLLEMEKAGVDFFTSGNHIWSKEVAKDLLEKKTNLIRPANFATTDPGLGYQIIKTKKGSILIINLLGRVFVKGADNCRNPFRMLDEILSRTAKNDLVASLVDFHAEATSEKVAFGFFADGRVSAVLGTHTHIPTADQQLLPQGTAYVSDVGMVGPQASVLGANQQSVINSFLSEEPGLPIKEMHEQPTQGTALFNSILLEIDPAKAKVKKIKRLDFLTKIS